MEPHETSKWYDAEDERLSLLIKLTQTKKFNTWLTERNRRIAITRACFMLAIMAAVWTWVFLWLTN